MSTSKTLSIHRLRNLAPILLSLALSGCLATSTPPSSLLKLARLSPLETDPGIIRLAAEAPEALFLRDGDIRLRMRYDAEHPDASFVEEYGAIIIRSASAIEPGIRPPGQGRHVFIARLTNEDAQSMRKAQKRVKDSRAVGIDGRGSLTISATACAQDTLPDGPLAVTTYMQSQPGDNFFVVTRNIDLRDVAKASGQNMADIEKCSAAMQ